MTVESPSVTGITARRAAACPSGSRAFGPSRELAPLALGSNQGRWGLKIRVGAGLDS